MPEVELVELLLYGSYMAMIKSALVKDGVVVNIISIDRDSNDADLKRYELEKSHHDEKMNSFKALEEKLSDIKAKLDDYKYQRDYVIADGEEFDKLHGDKVKGLIREKGSIETALLKQPKPPKPPKGHYEAPEGHELIDLGDDQACDIGWIYNGSEFERAEVSNDG